MKNIFTNQSYCKVSKKHRKLFWWQIKKIQRKITLWYSILTSPRPTWHFNREKIIFYFSTKVFVSSFFLWINPSKLRKFCQNFKVFQCFSKVLLFAVIVNQEKWILQNSCSFLYAFKLCIHYPLCTLEKPDT